MKGPSDPISQPKRKGSLVVGSVLGLMDVTRKRHLREEFKRRRRKKNVVTGKKEVKGVDSQVPFTLHLLFMHFGRLILIDLKGLKV